MIHPILKARRSPVMYSDRAIKAEDLISLFEAARWSPSSRNQQPWRYIVALKENAAEFNKLMDCLAEGNKTWTKNVPVLCLSIAETISDYKLRENTYAKHDVGLSTASLIFQAMSLGIYAHVMGGFDSKMAKEATNIPERFQPVAMLALGYPAESTNGFAPELIEREKQKRVRKEITEILFYGKWGNKYPFKNER